MSYLQILKWSLETVTAGLAALLSTSKKVTYIEFERYTTRYVDMSLQCVSSDTYKFEHTCGLQETLMPTF